MDRPPWRQSGHGVSQGNRGAENAIGHVRVVLKDNAEARE